MTTIILRCDDVHRFTRREDLEAVYGRLLEAGVPLAMAVIPRVHLATPLPARSPFRVDHGLEYEPYIPADLEGKALPGELRSSDTLVEFLRGAGVEILQHGLTHELIRGLPEFAGLPPRIAPARLQEGLEILHRCFPHGVAGFVPPHDTLSRQALAAVAKEYPLLSLLRTGVAQLPGVAYGRLLRNRRRGRPFVAHRGCLIVEHPGCIFSALRQPAEAERRLGAALSQGHGPMVLVTHYWEFLLPRTGEKLLRAWRGAMERLLSSAEHDIGGFASLGGKGS